MVAHQNMNKIIQGDAIEELKQLDENSVDTIITDPPYGLSFMGKKWDYDVPGVELWKECLRVLKPGGTALIFVGSRTQHRMAVNVEDAGFILKDTIMWLYGSGFPKATDISKQLDKGVERKVIGKRFNGATTYHHTKTINDGRSKKAIENCKNKQEVKITEPATPEAKLWNGWKSHGLKPAYEPIIVAQKPNDGTYANNALKYGVSGLNIDGGRIGTEGRFPANLIHDGLNGEEWNRYFYCAKASKAERNEGCEELEKGCIHPTVKPLKLMEYLCTLTKTPTGGRVLDPFAGSGTTGLACKNTGRDYILIEKEEEYIEIIKARLTTTKED